MLSGFADNGGETSKANSLCRPPPSLARDKLKKAVLQRTDNDRLDDAVFTDRIGQFFQCRFIEVLTGLMRVGKDAIDIDFSQLVDFRIRCAQQGAQTSAQ